MIEKNIIRGASRNEVASKKFNVYLGISLGNKWFNEKNITRAIGYGLEITKDRFGLLIADTLHAINYEVRNKMSLERAMSVAIRKGEEMESLLRNIVNRLPREQRERIDIIRWDEVLDSEPFIKRDVLFLSSKFEKDEEFRNTIRSIVLGYLSDFDKKRFNDKQIDRLSHYILEEFPEILNGFEYNGVFYDAYIYPYDGLLTQFVERVQKSEVFPELHKEIKVGMKVFISLGDEKE